MKEFLKKYKLLLTIFLFVIASIFVLIIIKKSYFDENVFNKGNKNIVEEINFSTDEIYNEINYNYTEEKKDIEFLECGYQKKKDGIYYDNILIKDADLETFECLDAYNYGKDKENIYLEGDKLFNVDYNTFVVLGGDFFKDKNHIYYNGDKIVNVDYDSFEVLNGSFVKDKNFVYYVYNNFEKITKLDSKSTVSVYGNYAKDKNRVFCNLEGMGTNELVEMKNVDIITFDNVISPYYGHSSYYKDKNNCYDNCEIAPMSECEKIENQE